MSKWTKILLAAVALSVLCVGTASATVLGSDDFNRADATDLGPDWLYMSNECNIYWYYYGEQNDPTAGIVSNETRGINPVDRTDDMLYGAPQDDQVDNATMLFRTAYVPAAYQNEAGKAASVIDGPVVVEMDIAGGSWDGVTLHQSVGYSTNPTYPPPFHDGYYWYSFNTVFRNTPGDTYGGMRIQKMSSTSQVGGYGESGIAALEALPAGTPTHLKATSDNAGALTFEIWDITQTTLHHSISWTDPTPYTGGYAGFQNTYGTADNWELTPEPATMGVLLIGAVGFLLRRRR